MMQKLDPSSLLSPNIAVGVEAMNTMTSSPNRKARHFNANASNSDCGIESGADEDEMVLKNHILLSRAHGDRLAKERAEDDLKYARHLLKQRDKQLEEDRDVKQKKDAMISTLRREVSEKDCILSNMKGALADARALVNNLQIENANLREENRKSKEECRKNTKEQGSERANYIAGRFKDMHKDKVTILRLKKKISKLHEDCQTKSCAMENALMSQMDTFVTNCVTIASVEDARIGAEADEDDDAATKYLQGRKKLITYDALRRNGRKGALPGLDETLDLRMPEDKYIAAKIDRSSFNGAIGPMKNEMTKMAHDWKAFMDTTLSSLWYIFQEQEKRGKSVLANPRDDFMREISTTLKTTKAMLFKMMKSVNTNVKDVLNSENAVKVNWVQQARPSKDFECQADIPPPEDPRIAELNERVEFLTDRMHNMRDEHLRVTENLELEKEKAEVNAQFLQNKIFALHEGVYTALHSVYKHRFHWIHRLPNNFAQIDKNASKKKQLEVRFNVDLAKAIDEDVRLLNKFTDYFVSDDSFGVDMSGARNAEKISSSSAAAATGEGNGKIEVSTVLRRKDAVPTKKKIDQARKLSNEVNTFLKKETSSSVIVNNNNNESPSSYIPNDQHKVSGAFSEASTSNQSSKCTTPTGGAAENIPAPPPHDAPSGGNQPLKRRGSFGNTTSSYSPIIGQNEAMSVSAPANPKAASNCGGSKNSENAHPSPTNNMANHRMEQWQKKQHDMWEAKKAKQAVNNGMTTMMLQLDSNFGTTIQSSENAAPIETFGAFENNRPPIGYRRTSLQSASTHQAVAAASSSARRGSK